MDISQVQVAGTGRDADRVRAMLAGKTDAAVASVEFSYLIESDPKFKVFEVFVKSLPNYLGSSIAVQNRTIREHSPQIQGFMIATAQGQRYLREHKEDAVDLGNRLYGEKKSRIAWTYDWYIENNVQDPNGYASPKSIMFMQELNVKLGRLKKIMPIEKVATWEFQKGLIAAIGEYKR